MLLPGNRIHVRAFRMLALIQICLPTECELGI